ncbi:unnamed protein product [Brachionus calyciflorus]|uniref:CCHC-type domain-containing protein n=1 Tax=Brachionus calyciflorus TaxID=104777 RepID=A0A814I534_9BILA|nr:unnamed protein product [Brachionus calyciflorus]
MSSTSMKHKVVPAFIYCKACKKCGGLNHKDSDCRQKNLRCLNCAATNHSTYVCSTKKYVCLNCNGQHSCLSEMCPKIIENIMELLTQIHKKPSYSSKVRSTPYSLDQVPSRSQVFYQQNQQVKPNNYHIPAFYLSQPLTPFNIQPSPNPTPINTQCQPTQQTNATGLQQSTVYFPTPQELIDPLNEQRNIAPKNYTIKFSSNRKFEDKYKDYFVLADYIASLKPNISITAAYISKNDELIIKTSDFKNLDDLRVWPENAFDYGLKVIIKQKKFYLALQNVDINFDIESQRSKQYLKTEYGIDDTLRMFKKLTKPKLTIVKGVTSDENKLNELIKTGYIKIGYSRIKVTPWRFGIAPDQCFKCQKFGHSAVNCQEKEEVCLRCSQNHNFKKCPIKNPQEFRCANCRGDHAACSKSCSKLIIAVEAKKQKLDKKMERTQPMVRLNSQFKSNQIPLSQALGLVKLIIELFKNLNQVTAAANEDPTPILNLITQNLGSEFSQQIGSSLFRRLDQEDQFMASRFIDNENVEF